MFLSDCISRPDTDYVKLLLHLSWLEYITHT